MKKSNNSPLLQSLVVIALAGAYTLIWSRAPAARPLEAPAEDFSAARALEELLALQGDGSPHPIGSAENSAVRERLEARLAQLQIPFELQTEFVCGSFRHYCGEVTNVLGRIQGHDRNLRPVALASHYDTQPGTPGAADAMAGVAAMLEVARALEARDGLDRDLLLLFIDGEEAGLLGSQAFLRHPWALETAGLFNLEARGNKGQSFLANTEGGIDLATRVSRFTRRPAANSITAGISQWLPNITDMTVYQKLDLVGADFGFLGGMRYYHSREDTAENLSLESLQQHGENALAGVLALDAANLEEWENRPGMYFTAGNWVIAMTASTLKVLSALLLVTVFGVAVHTRPRSLSLLHAQLLIVAAPVSALFLAFGLNEIRKSSWSPEPSNWVPTPEATYAGMFLFAMAVATLLAASLAKRDPDVVNLAVAGSFSTAACLLAWYQPSFGHLALIPAATTTVAALVVALRPATRPGGWWRAVLGGLSLVVWLPPWWFLRELGGILGLTPLIGAVLALLPLLPTLSQAQRRTSTKLSAALALAGFIVLLAAWRQPTFTPDNRQWVNINYVQDEFEAVGRWMITGFPVPHQIAEVHPLNGWAQVVPWRDSGTVSAAPYLALDSPQAEILEDARTAVGRRLTLRLGSPRGAPWMQWAFPSKEGPTETLVDGVPMPADTMDREIFEPGFVVYTHWTVPSEGFTLTLEFEGTEPIEIRLLDRSYGLPTEGETIRRLRPETAAPHQYGDNTLVLGAPITL